jgi:putative CocE/NonD family hydrolase
MLNVWLPSPLPDDAQLPTILSQTRYFRRSRYHEWAEPLGSILGKASEIRRYLGSGYAYVAVDVRGTGASFGWRTADMGDAERDDQRQLCDWIAAQPWSNAVIGTTGVSYEGGTAEHTLRHGHPAVRACIRDDMRTVAYLAQRLASATMPTATEISSAYARSRAEFEAAGTTFEQAAPVIRERLIAARRAELVDDWLADLRRRTDVVILRP